MKLTSIALFAFTTGVCASAYSQNTRVNIHMNNTKTQTVLEEIEKQTDYLFIYNAKEVDLKREVSVNANDETVAKVLSSIFEGTGIGYAMEGSNIMLMVKPSTVSTPQQNTRQITGTVLDATGVPVIGANVMVKGTTNGTITDIDGKFTLEVPKGAILQVSYIGYMNQEIPVGDQSVLKIALKEDTQKLDEVVVVGYGVMRKSDVTGAIASVNTDDMKKTVASSVDKMLQGRIPGLTISSTSGAPGTGSDVRIRGVGTLNNSAPLYVVDGIPMGNSNIDYLSPNDIESIEVLKDASSAAIYGSRAANGVILVTTKKGKEGKAKVVFEGSFGKNVLANKPEMLGAADFIDYLEESFSNDGGSLEKNLPAMLPAKQGIEEGTISPEGTDWWDAIKNNSSFTQNYYIGVSGSTGKISYNVSGSYYKENGLIKNTSYERGTFKMNTNYAVFKGFDLGVNVEFFSSKKRSIDESQGGPGASVYGASLLYDPTVPIYNEEGIPSNSRYDLMVNPLSKFVPSENDWSKNNRFYIRPTIKWEIVKGLFLNSNFSYYQSNPRSFDVNPEYNHSARAMNSKATISETYQNRKNIYVDAVFNYVKTFKEIHDINLMIGFSAEDEFSERVFVQKSGLPDDGNNSQYWSLDNAEVMEKIEANPSGFSPLSQRRLSYFGRANYNLMDKYLLQFSLRADGSSNFAPSNRWGVFPSLSLAWRINNEAFMKNVDWVSNLKLRGGYGVLGNDNIGVYKYMTMINNTYIAYPFGPNSFGSRENLQNGIQISSTGNRDLSWESTAQLNLAVDFGFFNNTISGSIDVYHRKTNDILINLPVSNVSGLTSMPVVNGASMKNTGVEMSLNYQNKISDFNYSITANFSYNYNEVTSLGYGKQPIYSNSAEKRTTFSKTDVGYPIAYFWGFKTGGIFQNENEIKKYVGPDGKLIQPNAKPGDIRFVDLNGDGVISDEDKTYLGDPTPNFNYGLNIDLSYKNWDLSMFWNGSAGFELINLNTTTMNVHQFENITKELYEKRWRGEGTSNDVPRLTFNDINGNLSNNSDRYVEKGDYLRLSNLQIGYTFNHVSSFIERIRLSLTGQNLLLISGFSGQDPEIGVRSGGGSLDLGMSYSSYPHSRKYMFGVNVVF